MKKMSRVLFLAMAVSIFTVWQSNAQVAAGVYVHVRPSRPHDVVVVRPPRPSHDRVWVSEEWAPADTTYVYHKGYWAVPPRPTAVWVPGHWRYDANKGYIWIPGHWS
jgi:hypothetical protein